MKRKFTLALSVSVSLMVLALLMFAMSGEIPTALAEDETEPLFEFQKKIEPEGEVLTVGDKFTVTITISPTAATQNLTYTWPITVYDPNMGNPLGNSGIYQFISNTLQTHNTSDVAVWDDERNGVIWPTDVSSATTQVMSVTFQGEIYDVPSAYDPTGTITNNAYIEAGAFNEPDGTPGSLPGSLPGSVPGTLEDSLGGSLPGSIPTPGSLPGSEVGHTMYTWDTMEIKPSTFEIAPTYVLTNTPYAIHVHSLTIINTGATTDTFDLTYEATDTSALAVPPLENAWVVVSDTNQLEVPAGLSATLNITVQIPMDEVKDVLHTLTTTVTSQNNGTSAAAVFETSTGGPQGCRLDLGRSGQVNVFDIQQVLNASGNVNPYLDFGHSGQVNVFDVQRVLNASGTACTP